MSFWFILQLFLYENISSPHTFSFLRQKRHTFRCALRCDAVLSVGASGLFAPCSYYHQCWNQYPCDYIPLHFASVSSGSIFRRGIVGLKCKHVRRCQIPLQGACPVCSSVITSTVWACLFPCSRRDCGPALTTGNSSLSSWDSTLRG